MATCNQLSQNRLGARRLVTRCVVPDLPPFPCRQAPMAPTLPKAGSSLLFLWKLNTAPPTQLASLSPQLSFILLSPPASANWSPSPTAVQAACMCSQPTSSVPPSQLPPVSLTNLFSGRHCHAPSPMTFAAFRAGMVPLLSDVPISSTGESVSFRTWPSPHASHLPYRCTILAMPDSSFSTKCSCPSTFASCPSTQQPSSHVKQTSDGLLPPAPCDSPATTYPRQLCAYPRL